MNTKLKNFAKKFWIIRFAWRIYKKTIMRFYYQIKRRSERIKRSRPAVIQLLCSYSRNDAIGNFVFELSNAFTGKCEENFIVSENYVDGRNCWPVTLFRFLKKDIVVYHMCIGSECSNIFKKIKVKKKIMIYHNITPSKFFYDDKAAFSSCEKGRKELAMLNKTPDTSICVSKYNQSELVNLGYKNICTIPCIHRIDNLLKAKPIKIKKTNLKYIITVGRIVRNKCIIDVIKTFSELHKVNSDYRLVIIGKCNNFKYLKEIRECVENLKLSSSIVITGGITESSLANYYRNASGYICMSEHEGFCVPLLEAMAFCVPVFAYNSSAIGETVGDAGILFETKEYKKNASIINNALNNQECVSKMKSIGLERFRKYDNKKILSKYLNRILEGEGYNRKKDPILEFYNIARNEYIKSTGESFFPVSLTEYIDLLLPKTNNGEDFLNERK